ncbi:hypothetical protein [Dorea longicatena]|uniref:Uncharacterized protein n=1 Tax=Dorea longicatena TaxID=88431 RepID=A0A845KHN9_9FIRM|nr:hypothetical protein [Dorea longicatena]MZK16714.1 hypothetical protein [Dorea longicatena]
MAYQAKRSKKYVEDFELVDAEGNIKHTLHISLDADDMTVKINRKYVALTRALSETTEAKRKVETAEDLQGVFETLGNAMVDLLQAVFGEENAKILLDFYEDSYIEMSREVLPFISNVVIPRMIEIRKDNQKALLGKYNRKQKISFLRR